ncbi:MAG: hypothetical protein SVO26_01875 [Chloroflexota bacterium]|nr:hypothetical protein [Chloroflexota bacterium]
MSRVAAEIANLDAIAGSLPDDERGIFGRIFEVGVAEGQIKPPQGMEPWIAEQFGSVERALKQRVVRITNLVTQEEALFNPLRASRPIKERRVTEIVASGQESLLDDPFHDPRTMTPEDTFGRIEGKYCITGSNIAKYEGFHSIIVFKEPDPLRFDREQVIDYIDTGLRWAEKAHAVEPEARYFFFMWNCGGRAGASLLHGHAQVMLGQRRHYAKVEQLRRAASSYRQRYGSSYFDDLYRVHRALGCGFERDGVRVLAYLTPVKENEVVLIADTLDVALKEKIYEVLACFRDTLGIGSFNLAIYMPPIAEVAEDWEAFPVVVRVVDRGDPGKRTSDIGAMELYASSVISSDPFEVARVVGEDLERSVNSN